MRQPPEPWPRVPTEQDAACVAWRATGRRAAQIERFATGLSHFVYDVLLDDGRQIVVRLTRPEQSGEFAGAVYWYGRLKPLGVPLAELLYADMTGAADGLPALVLERLPGTDLGEVYAALSREEKERLAREIAAAQRIAGSLPPAAGYGYALSYEDPALKRSWKAVLDASLERSRSRMRRAGLVNPDTVERVQAAIDREGAQFARVEPRGFLHDTTTGNVIVWGGRLSGIVDVDSVCFGDGLFVIALTRMALLELDCDLEYVDAWLAERAPDGEVLKMLGLYTAVFCVDFLAELGHAFNRAAPAPVDPAYVRRLLALLDADLTEARAG